MPHYVNIPLSISMKCVAAAALSLVVHAIAFLVILLHSPHAIVIHTLQ